jgi:hypothetical protein
MSRLYRIFVASLGAMLGAALVTWWISDRRNASAALRGVSCSDLQQDWVEIK